MIVRLFLLVFLLTPIRCALAETAELRLGVQHGLTYLPWAVLEHEKLIEAAAADAGVPAPGGDLRTVLGGARR